jgi:alkylated DNA repair protein (DNA oxidative demethylase)
MERGRSAAVFSRMPSSVIRHYRYMRENQMALRAAPLQGHLFPIIPDGLRQTQDLITREEESALLARLAQLPLEPFEFQGWKARRLVISYGGRYDFNDSKLTEAAPIPDFLLPLRARAAAFAGIEPEKLVQVLIARYDTGAGIGWHRDRPVFDRVIGISLGSFCTLRFRRERPGGYERATLEALPRSAYLLTGPARDEWEHSIIAVPAPRYSVTFRSLRERGGD